MLALNVKLAIAVMICFVTYQTLGLCDNESVMKKNLCMRKHMSNSSEALKTGKATGDYTALCTMLQSAATCLQPITESCASVQEKISNAKAFIRYNGDPAHCNTRDLDNNVFKQCMPYLLSQCSVHIGDIKELIKKDENVFIWYTHTCLAVRKYAKCMKSVNKGCTTQVLDTIDKNLQPYREHEKFDCFPGVFQPVGFCRKTNIASQCDRIYLPEILVEGNSEFNAGHGFKKTCLIIQRSHDCVAIKASGCTAEVASDDQKRSMLLAKTYNCTLDKCSKIWNACLALMDSSQDSNCRRLEKFMVCIKTLGMPSCSESIRKLHARWQDDLSIKCATTGATGKTTSKACDYGKLKSCNIEFQKQTDFINNSPNQNKAIAFCGHVRVYIVCLHDLIPNCHVSIKERHDKVKETYKGVCSIGKTTQVPCVGDTCSAAGTMSVKIGLVVAAAFLGHVFIE